jgi:pimeloyl-ACP methyl ester carboxylesterase
VTENKTNVGPTLDEIETAPNKFVQAGRTTFAYRMFGKSVGTPLVLLQHFSGNMDCWDPAVANAFAENRTVVVFDNAGVGMSTGNTPDNVAHMATDAARFIAALGLEKVDLLGHGLGGLIAQKLAAEHSALVRKLLLVGTAAQGGVEHLMAVLATAVSQRDIADPRLPLFFTGSEASQAAGRAFLMRAKVRTVDRDTECNKATNDPQAKALISWCEIKDPENSVLAAIDHHVLIVSGSNDTMFPDQNAYYMSKHLKNARLIIYPDSGHGVPFQYPQSFVDHAELFLNS